MRTHLEEHGPLGHIQRGKDLFEEHGFTRGRLEGKQMSVINGALEGRNKRCRQSIAPWRGNICKKGTDDALGGYLQNKY